tara:strand:- start:1500 stop:1694 length:195 start_codon:yes stop_codon:yes gene_type:complete
MSDKKVVAPVAKTVKVTLVGEHFVEESHAMLWGFDFKLDGKVFVCEMSKEDADANIKANRVKEL